MNFQKLIKKVFVPTILLMLLGIMLLFTGCEYSRDNSKDWAQRFNVEMPDLTGVGDSEQTANAAGWYATLIEEFDTIDSNLWAPSPNGERRGGYWCDEMIEQGNGEAIINAKRVENHTHCKNNGYLTSGIDTRDMSNGVDLFKQAYGYYECRVELPKSGGMWAAMWLQTSSIGQIGNEGMDGSEIDIFESSFYNAKRDEMGHAIHYDGYGSKHRCVDTIRKAGSDLYEGYHTFALKWTPNEYVFYIDGVANWATNAGGVCRVPAFIRFTCEIDENSLFGPYGQHLGKFDGGQFKVDYVKVYQNIDYLKDIKSAEDFK